MEKKQEEKGKEIVIDATNGVLGRIAAMAAKQALQGHNIVIVNSEKAIITGTRQDIRERYRVKIAKGIGSLKGPYFPKTSENIMKRTVRGMLNYKKARGAEAFKKVLCYNKVPEKYASAKKITFELKDIKHITLGELSKLI